MGCTESKDPKAKAPPKAQVQVQPPAAKKKENQASASSAPKQTTAAAGTSDPSVGSGSPKSPSQAPPTKTQQTKGRRSSPTIPSIQTNWKQAPLAKVGSWAPTVRTLNEDIAPTETVKPPVFKDGIPNIDLVGVDLNNFKKEPPIDEKPDPFVHTMRKSPTSAECDLAVQLGIDPTKEPNLVYLARELMSLPAPIGWEEISHKGEHLFRRVNATEGQLEHPLTGHYRHLVHDAKNAIDQEQPFASPRNPKKLDYFTFSTPCHLFLSDYQKNDGAFVDWNDKFQKLWGSSSIQPHQLSDREKAIVKLLSDFSEEAEYAAVEFVHQTGTGDRNVRMRKGNLLLSYQNSVDNMHFYGSRELAVKMHQHEMMGYRCVMSANLIDLHVPLHCTVSYLGNRVTVVAAVPLTDHSMILGPKDPSVPPKDRQYIGTGSEVESLLEIMSSDFRLSQHRTPNMQVVKVGAATTEAHSGTDGRYYVTQASRTLPCLPVVQVDTKRFRPELVKTYRQTKGLMNFSTMSEKEMLADLQNYLDKDTIDFFANWLVSPDGVQATNSATDMASVFHHFGVNIRKICVVYDKLKDMLDKPNADLPVVESRLQDFQAEMFSRALKTAVRSSNNPVEAFEAFMEDPVYQLKPIVKEKFGWTPPDMVQVDKETVLKKLAKMLKSVLHTSRDSQGNLMLNEVDLNHTVMTKNDKPRPTQPIFSYSRGYCRFRPEILRALNRSQTSTHISSDSLSSEGLDGDITVDAANMEALLSEVLLNEVIPRFAKDILTRPPEDQDMLCKLAHENGINLRYLGITLHYLNEANDPNDWRIVKNSGGVPLAVDAVKVEMYARSFLSFYEDRVQGRTYSDACRIARNAFQALIDDPVWLTPRMYSKFTCPSKFSIPAADVLMARCIELCGATVVMKDPVTVESVGVKPVMKVMAIPPHLRTRWLMETDTLDTSILPAVEHALVDRCDARPKGTTSLPLLALLSLLYQRWETEEPGKKQQELLDRRQTMVNTTDPASEEHGQANLLLGEYYNDIEDYKQAARCFSHAYSVLDKRGSKDGALTAALGLAQVLKSSGDDKQSMEWFARSRDLASNMEGVGNEKIVEIDTVTAAAFAHEGRYHDAVKYYTQAIDMHEKSNGEDEGLAKLLEARARAHYSMCRYPDSARDFERATHIYNKVHGRDCISIADVAVCLGQIRSHEGASKEAKVHFETALQIYKKHHGPTAEQVVIILNEHLAPLYMRMELMSQHHKCQLEVLLMTHADDTDPVAQKYFEVALAYERENLPEQAVKYFQLALISHRKVYGKEHKYTIKCLEWLEHLGGADPQERPLIVTGTSPRFGSPRVDIPKLPLASQQTDTEQPMPEICLTSEITDGDVDRELAYHQQQQKKYTQGKPGYQSHFDHQSPPPQENLPLPYVQEPSSSSNMLSPGGGGGGGALDVGLTPSRPSFYKNENNPHARSGVVHMQPDALKGSPPSALLDANYKGTPGSPSFYKQEPRTIRSILFRSGIGSFSAIPVAQDIGESDTSSEWD